MFSNDQKKIRKRVAVEIELEDGALMMGNMFVFQNQRLSDLLNDDRRFLPVENAEGLIVNLRKSRIAQVTELNQNVALDPSNNPYAILGVPETVSDEELRAVYHEKVREAHPDKWAGLGLPDEIAEVVNKKMARINDAFHRILKARGRARSEAES